MNDIAPLETRMRAALHRAQAALEAVPSARQTQAQVAALEAELSQAQAKLAAASEAPDPSDIAALTAQLAERDAEITALKSQQITQAAGSVDDAAMTALQDELRQKEQTIADLTAAQPDADFVADLERQNADLKASLAAQPDTAQDMDALQKALDEERAVNADLDRRVTALKASIDRSNAEDTRRSQSRAAHIEALDEKAQRLQQVNADLRTINGQLRKALAEGSSDAELINRAMEAELDALRDSRATEAAEVAAILNEMKPIIEGTS